MCEHLFCLCYVSLITVQAAHHNTILGDFLVFVAEHPRLDLVTLPEMDERLVEICVVLLEVEHRDFCVCLCGIQIFAARAPDFESKAPF